MDAPHHQHATEPSSMVHFAKENKKQYCQAKYETSLDTIEALQPEPILTNLLLKQHYFLWLAELAIKK